MSVVSGIQAHDFSAAIGIQSANDRVPTSGERTVEIATGANEQQHKCDVFGILQRRLTLVTAPDALDHLCRFAGV
jgi:hypothetical protein